MNEKSKFIIDKYKTKPCKSLKEFKDFLTNKDQIQYEDKLLKLELFFWRYHNTDDPKIYLSCVPNGTCGFQMEHLLRERKEHSHSRIKEFDQYIFNPQYHITTEKQFQYFTNYIKSILNNKNFFQSIKRPYISDKLQENNILKNQFKNYDDWYSTILDKYGSSVPDIDSIFYRYQKAYEWILNHKTDFKRSSYPKTKTINGRNVLLWYNMSMLKYTSMDRSFSIFQDNKNLSGIPYIKHFYILDFTTACQQSITEMFGYKYSYEEVSAVAEDLNHEAGYGSHFYLLPTILLENNLNEGLIDFFQNINHILDYGEFRHPEYDPMLRRG